MLYDNLNFIRSKLADEESRSIFDARLQFAVDRDLGAFFHNIQKGKIFRQENKLEEGDRFVDFFQENKNKKIIIYGAGYYGKLNKEILETCGYGIFAFGDSNSKLWGDTVSGIRILSDLEIINMKNEAVFIIGAGNDKNTVGIYRKLIYCLNMDRRQVYLPRYGVMYAICGQQYFDFFEPGSDEIFVDAGAFDGQTSVEFTKWCPGYKDIYMFEANNRAESSIKKTMVEENISKYHLHMKGISNCSRTVNFYDDVVNMTGSQISSSGEAIVPLVSLDETIDDKVTFIKMDIEGEERNALLGAENLIKTYKPRLAVCVYHKIDDFFRIPELILNFNKDYRIALRHYTTLDMETVLYAW